MERKVVYLSPEDVKIWEPFSIPQTEDDLNRLKDSIKEGGIKTPVIIDRATKDVVSGNTRVRVARELGLTLIPVLVQEFKDEEDKMSFFIEDNLVRRHLTMPQKIELGLKLAEIESAKAAKRRLEAAKLKKGETLSEKIPKQDLEGFGKALDAVAKKVGVSRGTLEMAKAVKKESPELLQRVLKGEESISRAYKNIKTLGVDVDKNVPSYNKIENYAKVGVGYLHAAQGLHHVLQGVILTNKDLETVREVTGRVINIAQSILDKIQKPEIPDKTNLCVKHKPCPKAA